MSNIEIENIDTGSLILDAKAWEDAVLTLGGADELKAGTILARNTSTLKMQLYAVGGSSNGNGVPQAVLTYALSAPAAGDYPVRVLVAGKVQKKRLVVDAAGDDSTISNTVRDLLREHGILLEDTKQLGEYDNQGGADS